MLYGGIPEGSQVLVAGGPGAGKTLLSFEFLYKGAKEMDSPGVFFALEEDPQSSLNNIKATFSTFTDIDDLIAAKKITMNDDNPARKLHNANAETGSYEFGTIVSDIESMITASGAKRAVVDSISVLNLLIDKESMYRKALIDLISNFKRLGVTTLLTMEAKRPERSSLEFKPEFFVFDGIFNMYQNEAEEKRLRGIEIIKMRGIKHSAATNPYEITENGFKVFSAEDGMFNE